MARTSTLSFSASIVAKKEVAFSTTRKGADRMSDAVTMLYARYEEETQTIKIFSSDGKLRECRIERLPSKDHAKALWKMIQQHGKAKTEVKFVAAGGFTPDRWFYQIVAA